MAVCGASLYPQVVYDTSVLVVRTPEAPGVDPRCTSLCPSDGYVYGVGLSLSVEPWVLVEVAPPWEIITSSQTPYCADSLAKVSTVACAAVATHVNGNVYVMTRDPAAPARNITLTGYSTQPSCPADGGI